MSAGAYVECVRACNLSGAVAQAALCLHSCSDRYQHSLSTPEPDGLETGTGLSLGVSVFLAVLLVPLTGLFAGLTLGLLSLDIVGLKILEQGGEPHERQYARKIMPVRQQGNLLLCTLLLGNTVINSAISILLADLTTGFIGLLVATFVILIFGEIVPQSICTQKEMGLKIGAHSIWLVKAFMLVLSPIVWPISRILDHMLGRDIGTVYSQEELKRLIDIHVSDPDAQAESGLTCADQKLIIGALEYKDKLVKDVMTSLEQVFMLERSLRLTFQTMMAIYKSGFTRIPVYEGSRQNIVGILYAKDLILVDPDDELEVNAVLSFRGRNAARVSEAEPLDSVFKLFMTSANHMLLAHDDDSNVTGLLTLEDVIEELIQAEIVDETDIYEDVNTRVPRQVAARVDLATFMMMFEHKLSHQQVLSAAEAQAVAAFLSLNIEEFAHLANFELPLKGLISHAEVLEQELNQRGSPTDAGHAADSLSSSPPNGAAPFSRQGSTPSQQHLPSRGSRSLQLLHWDDRKSHDGLEDQGLVLYEHGQLSDVFTLLLQGKACIRTGVEGFELELGPWSVLGNKALSTTSYIPDFTAVIWPPYRVLRIRRAAYQAALEATHLGLVINSQRGRLGSSAASDAPTARSSPGLPPVVPPLPLRGVPEGPAGIVLKSLTPSRLSGKAHASTSSSPAIPPSTSASPAMPPTSQSINSAADAVRTASPVRSQDKQEARTSSASDTQFSFDGVGVFAPDPIPMPTVLPPSSQVSMPDRQTNTRLSEEINRASPTSPFANVGDRHANEDSAPLLGFQKRK